MEKGGHYHCAVKAVGRADGRSVVAASAYRAGEAIEDERTGVTHDFSRRQGVTKTFIIARGDVPEWARRRAALWNAVEAATKAKNGRLATELELGLPHELTQEQRRALVEGFAREIAERHGVAVDVAIHAPGRDGDIRNHHAHLLITHREIGPDGVGKIANEQKISRRVRGRMKEVKTAGVFNEADIVPARKAWADAVNTAYAAVGLNVGVDHRSHVDRGLSAEPTKHLGPAASAMEWRGEETERGDHNRAVATRNAQREALENDRQAVSQAIADLVAERRVRAEGRAERAAVRTASEQRILEAMTEKRATFTRAELVRVLAQGTEGRAEAAALANHLLARANVVGLRETTAGQVTRYTTREVLADERRIMTRASALAEAKTGGLNESQCMATMKLHSHLDEEQRAAFAHATAGSRFAMIAGEAGTGKTTTFAAIRDAYEKAGCRVVGMAWTNSVVQDMRADGFREASTIASALAGNDKPWNHKTILMVDEAAMLSSRALGQLLDKARETGAKVILAGDDRQLASIERGGIFGALRAEHGAAELHQIYRVKDDAQKVAYNAMHRGDFTAALAVFDKAGAIQWTATQTEARAALVTQWAADTLAAPKKSRFVFAYTNADVIALNADLRAVRKARGELGSDHVLPTQDGPVAFSVDDRVQFTGSAYGRQAKAAGLVAGAIGTVQKIEGEQMTVALDGKGGKPGRTVSFTVGENEEAGQFDAIRHGYAGTIYKGQGRTLDETYLYHSQHWRAASAYVALSRHRESTRLFVGRDVTRGAEPWRMATGGVDGLDERQRHAAERSYDAWAAANPRAAERRGLADYVAYVQGKQGGQSRNAYDMEQLVRQISRADETRAASQFIAEEAPDQTASAGLVPADAARRAGLWMTRTTEGLRDRLAMMFGRATVAMATERSKVPNREEEARPAATFTSLRAWEAEMTRRHAPHRPGQEGGQEQNPELEL